MKIPTDRDPSHASAAAATMISIHRETGCRRVPGTGARPHPISAAEGVSISTGIEPTAQAD
jgi:hypothetical protein